jgi:D-alanine transaminase
MASGRLVYLNGALVEHEQAKVSVEDRGFNFADGIYEVVRIVGGRGFRIESHLDRLIASARAIEIDVPLTREEMRAAMLETARANEIVEGTIYLQLTRGVAPRRHAFPEGVPPTLVMLARPFDGPPERWQREGVSAATAPDLRWGYCEVKTIGLLPNVIAYQHARSEGAYDAVLVRDGLVTEGCLSSVFCVRDGVVYTHPIHNILPGVTRKFAIEALRGEGVRVEEAAVTLESLREADEVFLTGTTTEVMPVVQIDGRMIGAGEPGPLTRQALELYQRELRAVRAGGG